MSRICAGGAGGRCPWSGQRRFWPELVFGSTKAIVVVAVELRGQGSGRLRLGVVPDLSNGSLCGFVEEPVDYGSTVHTDAWQGHRRLGVLGYDHQPSSQRQAAPGEWLLPRAHRAISNLEAWLHGTHRDVSRKHLQVYLDEFVFRHTRRRTPMAAFQTLHGLGADRPPTTYREITAYAA